MKLVNLCTLAVVIFGALGWGAVSWFGRDPVAWLAGEESLAARILYLLIALAGLWQALVLVFALRVGQLRAEVDRIPD